MGCALSAPTHGDFESCIADLKNALQQRSIISANQKGDIQSCAATANIPKQNRLTSKGSWGGQRATQWALRRARVAGPIQ